MKFVMNGYAAEPISAAIRGWGQAPMLKAQMQQQAELRNAQAYQAAMAGNKAAGDEYRSQANFDARQQTIDEASKGEDLIRRAIAWHVNMFPNASPRDLQVSVPNTLALNAIPKEMSGMPLANALAEIGSGKSYRPFTSIGNTGYGYDSATGHGVKMSSDLAHLYGQDQQAQKALRQAQAAHGRWQIDPQEGVKIDRLTGTVSTLEGDSSTPFISKRRKEAAVARAKLDDSTAQLKRLKAIATEIKEDAALGGITGWMGRIPNAPGSKASNVHAKEDTLRSQIAISTLHSMREMSKTGGALGNVSNYESQMLQDNLAPLSRMQSKEAMQESLQKIIDHSDAAIKRLEKVYSEQYGEILSGRAPSAAQSAIEAQQAKHQTAGNDLPQSAPAGGTEGQIPQDAIENLKRSPETRDKFDIYYGPGSAKQVLGY